MESGPTTARPPLEEIALDGDAFETKNIPSGDARHAVSGTAGMLPAPQAERPSGEAAVPHASDEAGTDGTEVPCRPDHRTIKILRRRISRYKAVFPEEIEELEDQLKTVRELDEDQLRALLEEIQFVVETRRSVDSSRGMFLTGVGALESAGPYIGLKLKGLQSMCASQPRLLRNVDEVALKYDTVIRVDPVARLAMTVGQLALAVDASNRRVRQPDVAPAACQPAERQQQQTTCGPGTSCQQEFKDL